VALWTRLTRDERDGPLAGLLILLTVASGMIDAVSILRLGHVFAAAMTGNLLFIGFAVAGAPGFAAANSGTALGAFVVGAYVAGGLVSSRRASKRVELLVRAEAIQCTSLLIATVMLGVVGSPPPSWARYLLIAVLAIGMGVQSTAVRHLRIPELTTTVMTNTLATLISDLRPPKWRGTGTQLRLLALVSVLVGAVVGTMLVLNVAAWCSLAFAAVLVGSVGIFAHLATRRGQPVWDTEVK
jgi:uncharacterized membrane protein YoaK (UPF0700 family)